jgi:hypothetical protein
VEAGVAEAELWLHECSPPGVMARPGLHCRAGIGAIAEAALGHVVGDKVEAAYRRGDLFEKRRKLMAAWATFCTTPATDTKVIPIGRQARS